MLLSENDFKKDYSQSVDEISDWIKNETNNIIQNVIEKIDVDTMMLLIIVKRSIKCLHRWDRSRVSHNGYVV